MDDYNDYLVLIVCGIVFNNFVGDYFGFLIGVGLIDVNVLLMCFYLMVF